MQWQDVCEHPDLKNLPFKIELNESGKIIMSPTKVYHSVYQGKLSGLLYRHLTKGDALAECAIKTAKGTKVADVAWAFEKRLETIINETECSIAPEICIEVISDSNTRAEMLEKKQLYFDNGAIEVWLCDRRGKICFYNQQGELESSLLAPDFPNEV